MIRCLCLCLCFGVSVCLWVGDECVFICLNVYLCSHYLLRTSSVHLGSLQSIYWGFVFFFLLLSKISSWNGFSLFLFFSFFPSPLSSSFHPPSTSLLVVDERTNKKTNEKTDQQTSRTTTKSVEEIKFHFFLLIFTLSVFGILKE